MDLNSRNPYDENLDPDLHALVQHLVERHGVVLDPQDPILILQSMNRHIIDNAGDQLQQLVNRAAVESRLQQEAYLSHLKTDLDQAIARIASTLRVELSAGLSAGLDAHKLAREIQNQVQRALRNEFSDELKQHSNRLIDVVSQCFDAAASSQKRVHAIYGFAFGVLISVVLFSFYVFASQPFE